MKVLSALPITVRMEQTHRGAVVFNPPPGWPAAPKGWVPPVGWVPPRGWPPAPPLWQFYLELPSAAHKPSESRDTHESHPAYFAKPSRLRGGSSDRLYAEDRDWLRRPARLVLPSKSKKANFARGLFAFMGFMIFVQISTSLIVGTASPAIAIRACGMASEKDVLARAVPAEATQEKKKSVFVGPKAITSMTSSTTVDPDNILVNGTTFVTATGQEWAWTCTASRIGSSGLWEGTNVQASPPLGSTPPTLG